MAHAFFGLSQEKDQPHGATQADWHRYALGRAEHWYEACIEKTREQGVRLLQALSWSGLAECYMAYEKRTDASKALTKAIHLFEQCEAEHYLAKSKALAVDIG